MAGFRVLWANEFIPAAQETYRSNHPATIELDSLMVDTYYSMKREHGYTEEQIQRKRMSLEGVLVPVTAAWNEQLLQQAGFRQVDCFWRWMNFAAWVAVKE